MYSIDARGAYAAPDQIYQEPVLAIKHEAWKTLDNLRPPLQQSYMRFLDMYHARHDERDANKPIPFGLPEPTLDIVASIVDGWGKDNPADKRELPLQVGTEFFMSQGLFSNGELIVQVPVGFREHQRIYVPYSSERNRPSSTDRLGIFLAPITHAMHA